MRSLIPCIALSIATLLPSTGVAQEPAPRAEKLYYGVAYAGSQVATLNMFSGCPASNKIPQAMMSASQGLTKQLRAFTVRFDSIVNTHTSRSIYGGTRIVDGDHSRNFRTTFTLDEATATTTAAVSAKRDSKRSAESLSVAPHALHDMLSWLRVLRNKDALTPKKVHTYYIWDGWKLFTLKANVGPTSTIKVGTSTKRATRVTLTRTRLHHKGALRLKPKSKPKSIGTLWIESTGTHTPLRFDVDITVGKARVELLRRKSTSCKR